MFLAGTIHPQLLDRCDHKRVWHSVSVTLGIWTIHQILGKIYICMLEAYPIMLLLHIFSHTIFNGKLLLHTDNDSGGNAEQTVHQTHPTLVILREVVLTALKFNITFKSIYVPYVNNILSVLLFGLQVDVFRSRAKNMDTNPTPIPDHLMLENFKITSIIAELFTVNQLLYYLNADMANPPPFLSTSIPVRSKGS